MGQANPGAPPARVPSEANSLSVESIAICYFPQWLVPSPGVGGFQQLPFVDWIVCCLWDLRPLG